MELVLERRYQHLDLALALVLDLDLVPDWE
jgi:hypothetical protein